MSSSMTLDFDEVFNKLDVSKAAIDSTSLPNSILNRAQADSFIDMVVDYSTLLKRIRVERVNRPKGEKNKLDLGYIVTEGANTTSRATTRHPQEKVFTYDTEKYRSAFDLRTDFLEDNIERGTVRDTLMNMFTKQIAIDTEMASIEGDDSLDVGDNQSDNNNLLGVNDGFSKILRAEVPAAQQFDAGGAAPSKALFYQMKRLIPPRYRAARPNYVWIVPSGPADKYGYDISDRETPYGDRMLQSNNLDNFLQPGPWGIPMLEVPLMPEDLSFGTAGTDGSEIWLTPLQNLVYIVQRDITIEWDRQPRQDMWECTIHFRVDFEVDEPDMVIIATDVSMSGNDYA
jgi:hypothetical protein